MAFLACQLANSQTTVEEYTYLKNGYKVQVVEQGGDLKKGYKLLYADYGSTTVGVDIRKVTLYGFYRVNSDNSLKLAAHLLTYQLNNGAVEYICIPLPSSKVELKRLYLESIYDGDANKDQGYRLQAIVNALSIGLKG